MQGVAPAGRPAGHDRDDDLRHEADEALHLQDVQAAGALELGVVFVLIPVSTPDALVAPRTERPTPVLGAGSVSGEQHDADARVLAGVIQCPVQLVDGVRPEGVAHLGPIEGDAGDAPGDVVVVGDVGQFAEAVDLTPQVGVEQR